MKSREHKDNIARTLFCEVENFARGICMSSTLNEQINQLKGTIAEMEAQRAVLGDDFVNSTLITLRVKTTFIRFITQVNILYVT